MDPELSEFRSHNAPGCVANGILERVIRAAEASIGQSLSPMLPDRATLSKMPANQLHTMRQAARKAARKLLPLIEMAESDKDKVDRTIAFDYLCHVQDCISDQIDTGERMAAILPDTGSRSTSPESGLHFIDAKTGKQIRALGPKDSFADAVRSGGAAPKITFGDFAAKVITGRAASPEVEAELRTMAISPDASGGYAVPAPLSPQFIDAVRARAAVTRAGALVIPMTSNTLTFAKNAGDPSIAWKNENAAWSASDMTLTGITLTARTLGGLVKMSQELWDDAPNIGTAIQNALAQASAVELDRVALVGTGTAPEPRGIYNTSNIGAYTLGGTLSNYDPISRAVQLVREANHEPVAMIAAPRTYGELDRLKDSTGQPLQPPKSFSDLRHYPSGNVPVDQDEGGSPAEQTCAFIGDWSNIVIGLRNDISLLVSNVAGDGATAGITHYQVFVRVAMRADIALLHPEAFAVVKDIFKTS